MTDVGDVVLDAADYRPNPNQARFHASRAKVKAFLAGYRGGKSRAGAEESLVLAVENEGLDGLIVAPTMNILHTVTLRAFHDWESHTGTCPIDLIAFHNVGKKYFQLINGSRVYYGSADRPGSLEGTTLSWWWLDEARLVRREAWRILIARLSDPRSKRLQGLVTSTPAAGWLQEEFGSEREEREAFNGSTRENAAHLPPGYVQGLEKTYSPREARVLIDGEFGLLVGVVYEEFDRATHLIDWKYDPRLRTRMVWDPGHRMPYVGWAQHLPPGRPIPGRRTHAPFPDGAWVIFDELVPEHIATDALGDKVVAKGYRVEAVDCDPAAETSDISYGVDPLSVMRSKMAGLRGGAPRFRFQTEPRLRYIPTGVSRVRGMLKNAAGETRLYVARSLLNPKAKRGVVKDFEGYGYPEAKDGRPTTDQPLKDGVHDHGMDGWRYFAVNLAVDNQQFPDPIQIR